MYQINKEIHKPHSKFNISKKNSYSTNLLAFPYIKYIENTCKLFVSHRSLINMIEMQNLSMVFKSKFNYNHRVEHSHFCKNFPFRHLKLLLFFRVGPFRFVYITVYLRCMNSLTKYFFFFCLGTASASLLIQYKII